MCKRTLLTRRSDDVRKKAKNKNAACAKLEIKSKVTLDANVNGEL